MYRNLEAEMARMGFTRKMLAQAMGCAPSTLSLKLAGKAPVTLAEAVALKKILGVEVPLEELFARPEKAS